jgi:tetratricopeptide (TPR) repeat protein
MKDELDAMEAYLKELEALKKYDEAKKLQQELSQLKATFSQIETERDQLKEDLLNRQKTEEELCQLRQALNDTQEELSLLKETKIVLEGSDQTLEELGQEFIKARDLEIKARVKKEFTDLKNSYESEAPRLIYDKLLAILRGSDWPTEIADVIEKKAELMAQSRLDAEFHRRVNEQALDSLEQLKLTEWQPFVEDRASRLTSNLTGLALELQGTWTFACDRCHTRVSVHIGPRQIATLLRGQLIAECPTCTDFSLPPAPLVTHHKIQGSSLEDVLQAYLGEKSPGPRDTQRT